MAASLASGAAVVRARPCARARARACARARARARAVLLLRLEPVVLVVPVVVLVRGPRAWSSLSTLCRLLVFFLLACLSSCWKSSAGRTHTRRRARSRAKLCPHLFDVPICLSCLRRRSTTWSLTAQSSRARTVRWREFRAKLFFRAPQASADGESRCRQSRRSRAQSPFPGQGARANSWGQLPSGIAEMRRSASFDCTR